MSETRDRILKSAEELFARKGFDATSVRQIIKKARVNLAAIHYHFGSKEGLFLAVLKQRLEGIEAERLQLLEEAYATAGGRLTIEAVVDAFVRPVFLLQQKDPSAGHFLRLLGRRFFENPSMRPQVHRGLFTKTREAFFSAFREVLKECSEEDLFWRFHLMICTLSAALAQQPRLAILSEGVCDAKDPDAFCEQLTRFISNGIRSSAYEASVKAEVEAKA